MKKRGMYTGILAVLLLCACACTGQSADRPGTVEDVTAPTVATEQLTESVYPEHIENAFAGQEDTSASELSYTGERELTITGYSGKAGIVRIPAEIAGKPVVAIAAEAFAGNTALTALYVPKTVREIAAGALDQCTALRTLKMPRLYGKAEESRYLGYLFGAQDYNDNAKKVPASLEYVILYAETEVDPYAFFDCNDLLCVSLGNEAVRIGKFAFYGCKAMQYCDIGEAVTEIGAYAFSGSALTCLKIPQTVTGIGLGILADCAGLEILEIPFVGDGGDNRYLGYLFGAESYLFTAGYVPTTLKKVVIAEGCRKIDDHAFFECNSIQEVVIPESVTSIGLRAFYGCQRLLSVSIPGACRSLGDDAFFGCLNLKNVEMANGVTEIGMQAFFRCTSLERLELPDSVTRVGNSAFYDCRKLGEVMLGNGTYEVGRNAFLGCTAIETVSGGAHVTFAQGNQNITEKMQ